MKTVRKSFKSVSLATLILCAAAATAFAGQHSVPVNTGHGATNSGSIVHNRSQQVQVTQNSVSARSQISSTGVQASRIGQALANPSGATVRTRTSTSASSQAQTKRRPQTPRF